MVATELGSAANFIRCDVTVEEQVATAVKTVVARHGKLDVLLNSAGISCKKCFYRNYNLKFSLYKNLFTHRI